MEYIIQKTVEAKNMQEAIRKEKKIPVEECYIKTSTPAVGFGKN